MTGIDLVEEMIRIAAGEKLRHSQSSIKEKSHGWAMEARLYAENPQKGFMPSTGRLAWFRPPRDMLGDFRLDSGVGEGDVISMFYDPMIAKLITHGANRDEAAQKMSRVLDGFRLSGVENNLLFLNAIVNHKDFLAGRIDTGFIAKTWPDGFKGADLDEKGQKICLAAALYIYESEYRRAVQLTGSRLPLIRDDRLLVCLNDGHQRHVFEPEFFYQDDVLHIKEGSETFAVSSSDWHPGAMIWAGCVGKEKAVLQVQREDSTMRFFYKGATVSVFVGTHDAERITARLPERKDSIVAADLFCPMPGQVTEIHVKEGELVHAGQALLTIEAMKMENTLCAENDVIIKKILCKKGQSLGFDDLVMEFEKPAEKKV